MSFLASAMQTDHRPVLDDETYEELCQYLAAQGQLIPGRRVRSRDVEEVLGWIQELDTFLPSFHEAHRLAQTLSAVKARVTSFLKEDEGRIRRCLFMLDMPMVSLEGGDRFELKDPPGGGKPKVDDVVAKLLDYCDHEGVQLTRDPSSCNKDVLLSIVDECKPLNRAGPPGSDEADEAATLEDKKVKFQLKKKPTMEDVIEYLRRLRTGEE